MLLFEVSLLCFVLNGRPSSLWSCMQATAYTTACSKFPNFYCISCVCAIFSCAIVLYFHFFIILPALSHCYSFIYTVKAQSLCSKEQFSWGKKGEVKNLILGAVPTELHSSFPQPREMAPKTFPARNALAIASKMLAALLSKSSR